MSSTELVPSKQSKDLLLIERLASALEKCASVDEIKDVRDRAMAIQLYARKKAGGLAAAQSAGRVVTEATLKLAELYADETSTQKIARRLDRKQDMPGKVAIARAAEMDPAALSRLKPLVALGKADVKAAMRAIEEAGEVVTPAALLRQVTATSSSDDYDGDEWYTPPDFLDRVRLVLGEIDLDPASSAFAQKTVGAKRFFTKKDNGLTKSWSGNVFCNPPYSSPLISQFAEKFTASSEGKMNAGIFLVNNTTDTAWFQSLLKRYSVCFTAGRIAFLTRSGERMNQTRQGQAVFYFGRKKAAFLQHFGEIGTVVGAL